MAPMTTVTLHIGEHETVFTLDAAAAPLAVLPIGSARLGGARLSSPPRAIELEHAIEGIENAVMPLARLLPRGARLVTADEALRHLFGGAGPVRRDDVERAFQLLAEVAEGRPAAHAGLLSTPGTAGYLLILREILHHLAFDAVARGRD